MKNENKKKIPLGVKFLIILYALGVLFYIIAGVISIIMPDILSNIPNFDLSKFGKYVYYEFAALMAVFAIISIFLVYGLIRLRNWARIIAMIISAIFIIGGILSILEKNIISIINLILNLIILSYLLFMPSVKKAFKKEKKSVEE